MKRKIINNVQITYKIAAGYMIMLLVILFTSYIAYASISELNVYMRDMYFNRLLSLDYLLEADRDLQQLLVAERSMMVPHDDQKLYKTFLSDYEENKQQSETRVNKYKALPRIAKEKTIIEEYEQKRSEWEELSRTLMKRVASQDPEQKAVAMDLSMNKAKITFEEMRDKLDKLEEINLEQAEEKISEGARLFKQSLFIFAASIAFSVTLICMLAFIIIRNIKGRIRSVNSIVQDLADGEGDLTVRIQDLGLDEFRVLGNNLNIFMDKLETVVRSIFTSSVNLDGISQEVVSGNSKLSVSTQQMAGNIEEIAASIEEIVSSIKNTAGGVVNMTENILSIAETAEKSSETFGSLNTTMTGLQNAGKEINSIIDVVNGIAFQTNLLALNASVEAAHAGDEGKGFAVVASEVRNLAIRSTEAGKRIKELVEQNDEQIRVMSEITQSSVESIENILNKVYETKKHVHQIENMSREQSTGIEQISLAMNQIDQGVQENAAQVDKQTTVSDNMIMIAQELSNNVKKFKISEKI